MRFEIAGYTARGPVRTDNQDHVLVARVIKNSGGIGFWMDFEDGTFDEAGLLLAVADGMGGHERGREASRSALQALDEHCAGTKCSGSIYQFAEALQAGLARANEAVARQAVGLDASSPRPGTTLAGIWMRPDRYLVFNVGDSRVYRIRDNAARQLTTDDTRSGILKSLGVESSVQATDGDGQLLTNWLGSTNATFDVFPGPSFVPGDTILICTDGLYRALSDSELVDALYGHGTGTPVDARAQALLSRALSQDGHDNASVIVVRLNESQSSQPETA